MPGSKESARANEIREHLREHMPGAAFISRRTTNSGAVVIDRNTGRVLLKGSKNWEILEQLTNPETVAAKRFVPLVDIPPTINVADHSENVARAVLDYLNELIGLAGEEPRFVFEDGAVKEIRFTAMRFTINGRKDKEEENR